MSCDCALVSPLPWFFYCGNSKRPKRPQITCLLCTRFMKNPLKLCSIWCAGCFCGVVRTSMILLSPLGLSSKKGTTILADKESTWNKLHIPVLPILVQQRGFFQLQFQALPELSLSLIRSLLMSSIAWACWWSQCSFFLNIRKLLPELPNNSKKLQSNGGNPLMVFGAF